MSDDMRLVVRIAELPTETLKVAYVVEVISPVQSIPFIISIGEGIIDPVETVVCRLRQESGLDDIELVWCDLLVPRQFTAKDTQESSHDFLGRKW